MIPNRMHRNLWATDSVALRSKQFVLFVSSFHLSDCCRLIRSTQHPLRCCCPNWNQTMPTTTTALPTHSMSLEWNSPTLRVVDCALLLRCYRHRYRWRHQPSNCHVHLDATVADDLNVNDCCCSCGVDDDCDGCCCCCDVPICVRERPAVVLRSFRINHRRPVRNTFEWFQCFVRSDHHEFWPPTCSVLCSLCTFWCREFVALFSAWLNGLWRSF